MGGGQLQVRQLCHTIDKIRYLTTELRLNIREGRLRVLNRVVQQRGGERRVVHLLFCQNSSHSNRMGKVGLTRLAHLAVMHGFAKGIGLTEHVFVCAWVVGTDQRNQIICSRHVVRCLNVRGCCPA